MVDVDVFIIMNEQLFVVNKKSLHENDERDRLIMPFTVVAYDATLLEALWHFQSIDGYCQKTLECD
jgi:hypothetical protein